MQNFYYFEDVLKSLRNGISAPLFHERFKFNLTYSVEQLRSKMVLFEKDIELINILLRIGNITYNNIPFDDDDMPIDNGTYDLLLEMYKNTGRTAQVGAEPVWFTDLPEDLGTKQAPLMGATPLVQIYDEPMLFEQEILNKIPVTKRILEREGIGYESGKKYRTIGHNNPSLVGTLDKCKFVLTSEAEAAGVLDDPSVKVLERDFFEEHFKKGIVDPRAKMQIIGELKYDGISVVVTVRDGVVIAAVSRGDTGADKATDLTPILYGYRFDNLPNLDIDIDVKCEAVMTTPDLYAFNIAKGREDNPYKNCRSAIVGLFGANDGYLYQKFITLVPLEVAATNEEDYDVFGSLTRLERIHFMNDYLATKEYLRYAVFEGDFTNVLFQIKSFVKEAEYARPLVSVMYDGIVLSYTDPNIIASLGRENSVNKYSIAVKFSPRTKLTKLLGISYTVGQNGVVTPMAHYEPVEFIGTIHTKSSVSSVARFNENQFKIGNIVKLEYRHDVMPYISTPDMEENRNNPNPVLEFTTSCPVCGHKLEISSSGKSAICTNIGCKARTITRMANMMDKLGLKDFAENTMEKLGKATLHELMNIKYEEVLGLLGEVTTNKFFERLNTIRTEKYYDFQIIGALGFSDIASETWKKIFKEVSLPEVVEKLKTGYYEILERGLSNIRGIGPNTIKCIFTEYPFFEEDIDMILKMTNIVSSKGLEQASIRFTGVRDKELTDLLVSMGYDASDKSVNSKTAILIVPTEGHKSSKVSKVGPNTLIVPIQEFKDNMNMYLSRI